MQDPISMGSWGNSSEEILAQQFPLHRACRDGDVEKVSALLGDLNEFGPSNGLFQEDTFYGWTPAHWAAYFGKLDCLRRVIFQGELSGRPVIELTTSRFEQTPCHVAAFAGHPQCLNWLIQARANINSQDYLGETPLHKAARTGSMECVSLLVSQGASLSNKNFNCQNPAQLAIVCNFPECAQYLERAVELQKPPRGIFQDMLPPVTHAPPLDLTRSHLTPDHQHLTVISQGLNGGTFPHNNGTNGNSHEMEDDSMDTDDCSTNKQQITNQSHFNGSGGKGDAVSNGDVLMVNGICWNHVPVAGRKRGREEVDAECLKKIRTGEVEAARGQHIFVDGVEAVTILQPKFVNPNYGQMNNVVNEFASPNLYQNGAGKLFPSPTINQFNRAVSGFINPNVGKMNGVIRQVEVPTFGQITNPGHVTSNHIQPTSLNGHSNGVAGGHLWSHDTQGNMENMSSLSSVTNSVLEHHSTVHMQQGYDSLVVNSLITNTHGC